jgi:uncharacterized protein YjeT (DUF2065 family)
MEQAIEIFAAVNFFVMGLSHLLMPRAWTEFFTLLREKGDAGAFVNGFLTLGMGSLIVAFHNVWTGLPVVLTVIGWLYVIKSLLIFTVPGLGVRSLSKVSEKSAASFVVAGVMLLALGGLLTYSLVTT